MKRQPFESPAQAAFHRRRTQASSRVIVIVLLAFAMGAMMTLWLARKGASSVTTSETSWPADVALSDATRSALGGLNRPVDLRLYALFSADTPGDELTSFAQSVDALVREFERAAGKNLRVTRQTEWSDEAAKSAAADGITAQNLAKGEPSYLGIAVACEARKEALSQLTSEWRQALEFDLVRAITRVATPPTAPRPNLDTARTEAAATVVQRAIPDPSSVSLEEGQRILRDAAQKEFEAVSARMKREVADAEQRVRKAEAGSSEAERAAAQLQQIKSRYEKELLDLALHSQSQLEEWSRLKGQ